MLDWYKIIDAAEKVGEITTEEANDLRRDYGILKEAGLLSTVKGGLTKQYTAGKAMASKAWGNFKTFTGNPQNLQAMGLLSIGAPLSYQVGSSIFKPIKNSRLYGKMRAHLDEIEPSISRNYSEDHIRKVYSIVSEFSPTIASNPYVAATVVRDSINVPTNMDLRALKTISEIENAASGRGSGVSNTFSSTSDKLLRFAGDAIKADYANAQLAAGQS